MASRASSKRPVVLIVDDEVLLRLVLSDAFEDDGFEVLEAGNADEAIRILQERADIRLVVTDIQMPGSMDGLKLAVSIRNRWPPVELIIVSGRTTPLPRELPHRAHFFSKPYEVLDLLATAHQFLN